MNFVPTLLEASERIGGAERDRTVDLLNAIQALSQLSYSPTGRGRCARDATEASHAPGGGQETPQVRVDARSCVRHLLRYAGVAELADARDSKSRALRA